MRVRTEGYDKMMRSSTDRIIDQMEDDKGVYATRDFLQAIVEHKIAHPEDGNMFDPIAMRRLADLNAYIAWMIYDHLKSERNSL